MGHLQRIGHRLGHKAPDTALPGAIRVSIIDFIHTPVVGLTKFQTAGIESICILPTTNGYPHRISYRGIIYIIKNCAEIHIVFISKFSQLPAQDRITVHINRLILGLRFISKLRPGHTILEDAPNLFGRKLAVKHSHFIHDAEILLPSIRTRLGPDHDGPIVGIDIHAAGGSVLAFQDTVYIDA